MPTAVAPVFTGASNLVVFEVRRLKGFGWQCCLCLNSAVGLELAGRGPAFLFALVPRAWGLAPEDLVISMWTGSGSAESPGLLGFPVSSLTREAGLRMT